ncbi:carbonic anhydrase [Nitrosococcus wardiae]|uniref:Carbonic anhydrase n=1 Tax=Nitrosococcus wardiae TaxID=1814290 RepID=A0A4P7BYM7_9GAMM|nr:carbonic anhydrase family protein [Nitrosococcus wardiae]QBQ54447.1 carbonic anhydrase family protein [Nitrosococcus wardiae]
MKKQWYAVLAGGLLATSTAYAAGHTPFWDYVGNAGPTHWAELNPEYAPCQSGKNQSPINITGTTAAETQLPPLRFHYTNEPNEIINDGHTIQITFPPGNTMVVRNHTFELKQVHFHAPSEHHMEGKEFPMEGHLVHADEQGNLAVISIFYKGKDPNPALAKLWEIMPRRRGEHHRVEAHISAAELLPSDKSYYLYNGSLTTPPCTEGVWWVILEQPVHISPQQVSAFLAVMHHPNNRPEQPVNARVPLHSQ